MILSVVSDGMFVSVCLALSSDKSASCYIHVHVPLQAPLPWWASSPCA